jgi:hypothetical protein
MVSDPAPTLTTRDGVTLEARVGLPTTPRGGVVVCHPHPLYGGDMDNPVVIRIEEACAALGLATLRFNFRGVGRSTGVHGHGEAEQLDVEAGLAHLAGLVGSGKPLVLAGYSFGAAVVGNVAVRHAELAGVALVAPPLARMAPERFPALDGLGPRLLVVAGTQDEICPGDALRRLAELVPRATVHRIDGANHFFFGKLYPLGEIVTGWVRGLT